MRRIAAIVIAAGLMMLAGAGAAEARIFMPQPHWWTSGEACVGSRNPPGRRWRALPPRTCADQARLRDAAFLLEPAPALAAKVESASNASDKGFKRSKYFPA